MERTTRILALERLVQATPGLVGELDLNRLLSRIADLASELLDARYAAVGLLKADRRTLETFTTSGLSEEEKTRIGKLPVGHGILGLVIREGQIVRLKDLAKHPASVGFPANHPPMQSFLGVPIVGRDGIIGDLYLTEKRGADEFSEGDVSLALLLSSVIASAVDNVRSHEHTVRLLEEIHDLHRSRERFFAMVNHELRNSLAAVYGWSELLVRKKDPATVPRGAFEIIEAAEQAIALLNDLLDLNRLDEDRLRPVLRDVDCVRSVRTAVQRVTPAAVEKTVTFAVEAGTSPTLSRTDSHRLEQILVNLLINAIRHTPPGSEVTVSVSAERESAILTVVDQGPGVAPEDWEKVFDIYYSGADLERSSGGTGIGLPLSRRLARLLGGDLTLAVGTGPGARFVLSLPLAIA